jgi:hypothetical protein
MLSWNNKELVYPVCTVRILHCTFLGILREIFVVTTYIAYVGWLRVDKEVFVILAQISCE